MRTNDLDFELPESLIARRPSERRDASRLLVISRSDPSVLEHRTFGDLPALLTPGDVAVFNTSRVLPARFVGRNAESDGRVSGLYLREGGPGELVALVKARRMREGYRLLIDGRDGEGVVTLSVVRRAEDGGWVFGLPEGMTAADFLNRCGLAALPPYILQARSRDGVDVPPDEDLDRYQTVYADHDTPSERGEGSVAAPTAGLHFTPSVLAALAERGVARADVTLHVGRGTFEPVDADCVEEHVMHAERCSISPDAESAVLARHGGPGRAGRVFAVGTTSARTLESFAGLRAAGDWRRELETDLLITPGYRWRWVDGLVTNFHLPRSTLLAMAASLLVPEDGLPMDGVDRLLSVYKLAVGEGYRFFSYGDAMLVLP
ncbi:MAG: tRNA preQ1(34) S-adenosylmethionine ribosyltransferase-isomerase QueA [Planctomycetota bacterium]